MSSKPLCCLKSYTRHTPVLLVNRLNMTRNINAHVLRFYVKLHGHLKVSEKENSRSLSVVAHDSLNS